ncbi:MAG: 16S rRNA (guanine(966)-N(2))-methyltransferase RsmD [Raoultibacter sp.]|jgi:16S rRNA (guanine966-N2)-methyltransferase
MRIIAGEYRGRTIKALSGPTTRPTTDRVRESLMSALASARGGFEGAVVLDAFAGSGALGLEALSRGAQSVTFYERDAAACRVLRQNVQSLQIPSRACAIFQGDIFKQRPRFAGFPFDLVFLDPPYNTDVRDVLDLVKALHENGVISDQAIISYEHAKNSDSQLMQAINLLQCELVSHRSIGDTSLDILRMLDETDETHENRDEGKPL